MCVLDLNKNGMCLGQFREHDNILKHRHIVHKFYDALNTC